MKRILTGCIAVTGAVFAIGWVLTAPKHIDPAEVAGLAPDLALGEQLFHAGGCASCHAAPGAEGAEKLVLAGGHAFPSPFGTFFAPNISTDPQFGIGEWAALDLANAMLHGTGPDGQHYYPAFPYTSYQRMSAHDIVSLHSYLQTLPADDTPNQAHDIGFPFNIRKSLGGWKLLFAPEGWVVDGPLSEVEARGRFLVEGPGHCGACHTPRNALGGPDLTRWLAGAVSPDGKGKIPNITPASLQWSQADIAAYLQSGFTPDYDSAGGDMVDVIENMAKLSDDDLMAIAAYLKAIPAVE